VGGEADRPERRDADAHAAGEGRLHLQVRVHGPDPRVRAAGDGDPEGAPEGRYEQDRCRQQDLAEAGTADHGSERATDPAPTGARPAAVRPWTG
jgi:hypothetical protein